MSQLGSRVTDLAYMLAGVLLLLCRGYMKMGHEENQNQFKVLLARIQTRSSEK